MPRTPDPSFRPERLLKRDLMGTIEAGVFEHPERGPVPAIRRRYAAAPFWARPISWILARREMRALSALAGEPGVPALYSRVRGALIRSFIEGRPLQEAAPADPRFYS